MRNLLVACELALELRNLGTGTDPADVEAVQQLAAFVLTDQRRAEHEKLIGAADRVSW